MPTLHRILIPFVLASTSLAGTSQAPTGNGGQLAQHIRNAQQDLRDQRPDLAIPELRKIVDLDPENIEARANLGVLLYFTGDYKAAAPELSAALKTNPELWKIQALLGLDEAQLGDANQSRTDLETAFPHLNDDKTWMKVGRVLIDNYTATGDLDKAADIVSKLLDAHPTDKSLLYLSYRLYSDLAGKSMLTLAMVDPGSAEVHQMMAHELARHGDDTDAIANFREAIKLDPHLPGVYSELGDILYHSPDASLKNQAESEFKAALTVNPHDKHALLGLADIAERQGDQKSAFENYSAVIKIDPSNSDAYAGLGKVLVAMNQPDKARGMFETAVQIDPTNDVAHYRLATLYREEGKSDEAKEQVALYLKYKQMKDQLGTVFHDMRVLGAGPARDDDAPSPK